MQQIVRERAKTSRYLAFLFIANALVTIGFALLQPLGMYFQMAIQEGPLPSREAILKAEIESLVIVVLSAWGIVDAFVWARGKYYSGYFMFFYSLSHMGLMIYSYFSIFVNPLDLSDLFSVCLLLLLLFPFFIDGFVIWKLWRNMLKQDRFV